MIEPLEQAAGRLEGGADMEFGMPFLMETDTLEECARLCSQLGLGFIELNMNFPQCQLPELSADRAWS